MKKYNWVAQDKDGEIYTYEHKPDKLRVTWQGAGNGCVLHSRAAPNPNWKESLIDLSKNDYIIKDGILMATRKHVALIHAWVDGAVIQFKGADGVWYDCEMPVWDDTEFRIKPKTRTVKFRNWYSTDGKVYGTYCAGECNNPDFVTWLGDWREVKIEL